MKACRSCRNWTGIDEFLDRDDPNAVNTKVQMGNCRRYAPRPMSIEMKEGALDAKVASLWPLVPSDQACGEWEPAFDG